MKKSFLLLISMCLLFSCQETQKQKECITFEEFTDPQIDSLADWSKVEAGLNSSFVSIDEKFPKSVIPDIKKENTCEVTGWKGEKLSAQLLVWSADSIKQIECKFENFVSESNTLPANVAQARFVRYVATDVFGPGCGYRKPEDFPVSLAPDMLDNLECFDMAGKTVRPIWITIDIPQTASVGKYKGKLIITARDLKPQEFTIELNVQNKILPPAQKWQYHLDLWQHPSAVARVKNLTLWSDEHFKAMEPLMQMLSDAGQKVITATLNKDPWNVQTYDKYEDMILWTKNEDGTWTYDYTIFDKWVSFMIDRGINKMINCYSIVPWNNEIHYKNAKTGEIINVKADPGTKAFAEMWTPFLQDFVKHQNEKGWLGITNIAMDERSPQEMKSTLALLKEVAPELGISLADNHKSYKQYPYIKDMSVAASAKVDSTDITYRKQNGFVTTYYVCCTDSFPNTFTFSESAEPVYSAWYSMAAGYDGFLRWAYNSWVENPLTDSRFRAWPAGDTYIVYPDARSSIRFERLIEGIQDVEKIRILRQELKNINTLESLKKLDELNSEVAKFNSITPSESYIDMLNNAKKLINRISE